MELLRVIQLGISRARDRRTFRGRGQHSRGCNGEPALNLGSRLPIPGGDSIERQPCRVPTAIGNHSRHPQAFFYALLLIAVGCAIGTCPVLAAESKFSEHQVKAAFLINFPKYVNWPAEAFAPANSPIIIAAPRDAEVTAELQKMISGRTVDGRRIVLKPLEAGRDAGVFHVRFISAAEHRRFPSLLGELKNRAVLTVGETGDFLDRGGIINLTGVNETIGLEINLSAAEQAGLKLSSKLLSVARAVKGASE